MGINGCAHILSAVTREEHTAGGIPNVISTIEAIECAHVAAKIIDLEMLGEDNSERHIAMLGSEKKSCVASNNKKGCSRCSDVCPLI